MSQMTSKRKRDEETDEDGVDSAEVGEDVEVGKRRCLKSCRPGEGHSYEHTVAKGQSRVQYGDQVYNQVYNIRGKIISE